MPRKRTWDFTVSEDGKVPRAVWLSMVEQAKLYAGRPAKTTMEPPKRSSEANRYYWGCALATVRKDAVDSGQIVTSEALHEYFKRRHLDPIVYTVGGVEMIVYTTTELDSTQFFEYIEAIKNDPVVLELGCHIPDPETPLESWRIDEP